VPAGGVLPELGVVPHPRGTRWSRMAAAVSSGALTCGQ
jgi:hypothetical protein